MAASNASRIDPGDMDRQVEELMAALPDPPAIAACWLEGHRETLGSFADRTQQLVSRLRSSSAGLRSLYLVGNSKRDSPLLGDDLANLRPWIFRRSWHENGPTNAPYSHQQADGSLSAQSEGEMGFSIVIGNLQPPAYKLRLDISSGSPRGGSVSMTVPPTRADELCSVHAVKDFLQIMIDLWPVRCAFLTTRAWHKLVNPRSHDWVNLPIGGITYSSDGRLVEALPPGIEWETLGPGGILIKITERPDLMEPEATARAIAVREALAAHGVLRLRDPSKA